MELLDTGIPRLSSTPRCTSATRIGRLAASRTLMIARWTTPLPNRGWIPRGASLDRLRMPFALFFPAPRAADRTLDGLEQCPIRSTSRRIPASSGFGSRFENWRTSPRPRSRRARSYGGGEPALPRFDRVRSVPLIDQDGGALATLVHLGEFIGAMNSHSGAGRPDDSALCRRFWVALKQEGRGLFRGPTRPSSSAHKCDAGSWASAVGALTEALTLILHRRGRPADDRAFLCFCPSRLSQLPLLALGIS